MSSTSATTAVSIRCEWMKWMVTSNASSAATACQARRFLRRRPCASSSSISPMMTSALRVTLVSVPGTRYLSVCSRSGQSGLKMATISDKPMSMVSNAALPGTQAR